MDMSTAFSITNRLLAVVFVVGALAQTNDPDPALWVAIYLLAALACGIAVRKERHWATALSLAVIALVWGVPLLPQLIETGAPFGQIAQSMSAESPGIEFLREVLGLLIIAAWMTVLALRGRRNAFRETSLAPERNCD